MRIVLRNLLTQTKQYINLNQNGTIKTVSDTPLNCVEEFTYLNSKISSSKSNVNTHIGKARDAIDKLSQVWRSGRPGNMKRNLFQASVTYCMAAGFR